MASINSKKKINRSIITLTEKKINALNHIGNTKPIIYIGMGSCGLAAGAKQTHNVLLKILKEEHIDAQIIPVGCIGSCFCEPILDIKMPGKSRVVYNHMTKDRIPEFVEKVIKDEEHIPEWILGQYTSEIEENTLDIPEVKEHPYFKHQFKFVLSRCGIVDPFSLDEYISNNHGFKALADVLERNDPIWLINEMKTSGLRGRGGGGFPTGRKWEFGHNARSPDGQKYVIMNADEGDPGAFMDRALLESDPFSAIEGMAIMGFAIGASIGFIYCRAEYPIAIQNLTNAINDSRKRGLLGKNIMNSGFDFDIKIKKGAGAFVCGEETALINSIEGKRGMPRIKPPYPAIKGLWGRPTVVNNVETI